MNEKNTLPKDMINLQGIEENYECPFSQNLDQPSQVINATKILKQYKKSGQLATVEENSSNPQSMDSTEANRDKQSDASSPAKIHRQVKLLQSSGAGLSGENFNSFSKRAWNNSGDLELQHSPDQANRQFSSSADQLKQYLNPDQENTLSQGQHQESTPSSQPQIQSLGKQRNNCFQQKKKELRKQLQHTIFGDSSSENKQNEGQSGTKSPQKNVFYTFKKQSKNQQEEEEKCTKQLEGQHIYAIHAVGINHYYDIKEKLGEGQVGVVFRAIKLATKEEFAIKIVRTRDEETMQNIKTEFTNHRKLLHKNIVKVHELYIDTFKGEIYSVMELVRGKEMFKFINDLGCYNEVIAKKIFRQILESIDYMHKQRVCHRDLKPNNIMCSEDGSIVKVTDFNVSKFEETYKDLSGMQCQVSAKIKMMTYTGTLAFSAPEQLQGEEYDESIDMWSAGVILYTMLSGKEPFQADFIDDLKNKIVLGSFDFDGEIWKNISGNAKSLIKQCLQVTPQLRIKPEDALDHLWMKENTQMNLSTLNLDKIHIQKRLIKKTFNESKFLDTSDPYHKRKIYLRGIHNIIFCKKDKIFKICPIDIAFNPEQERVTDFNPNVLGKSQTYDKQVKTQNHPTLQSFKQKMKNEQGFQPAKQK